MMIKTKDLSTVADKILKAVDSSELNSIVTALELEVIDNNLMISVTNKEYFVTVKLAIGYNESFHASVNASLFLKLISQITTEDIELTCKDNYLHIKGNGSYKLPLIYKDEKMLVLDKINIYNPTCEMDIDNCVLQSIIKYNSKELTKGFISKPVQKYYYIDNEGCITFTTGACVNKFTLPNPVRFLINNRIVSLFKLFNEEKIHFTLGYDALSDSIIQTKARFETKNTTITAILQCDDTMINSVPVANIRNRANTAYPYSITISKEAVIQAINRIMLFNKNTKNNSIATFKFNDSSMIIEDGNGENSETINYIVACEALKDNPYEALLDLNDLKSTLSICDESHLTLKFGAGKAFIVSRTNIINVIPQCIMN